MKNALVIAALASAISAACRAASPAPLPESLLACTKLQDPTERVRCYDTQVAAITRAAPPTAAAPTAVAPAATLSVTPALPTGTPTLVAPAASTPGSAQSAAPLPAPAPAPVAAAQPPSATQFGEEQLPMKSRAAAAHKDEALLSSITELRTVGQKIYLISLANGQVWRQEGSQLPALFRVGNEVRIEKGAFGSYHLSAVAFGDKNWVLVTRTR